MNKKTFTKEVKEFLKKLKGKHKFIKIKGNIKFKCLKECGDVCCSSGLPVILLNSDLKKQKLKKNAIKNERGILELKKKNSTCILFKNGLCSVYNERPTFCRIYPFQLDPLTNELFYDSACKGIGKGKEVNLDKITQFRKKFWKILNLTKREKQIIHKLMFQN
jgi:Fe-S-cluster containining protein